MPRTTKSRRAATNGPLVQLDFKDVIVTPTGLRLPEGLPVEQWTEIGARLGRAHTGLQWMWS
jgi:hypothetical protein